MLMPSIVAILFPSFDSSRSLFGSKVTVKVNPDLSPSGKKTSGDRVKYLPAKQTQTN